MSSLTSFTLTVSGYSSGTIDLSYDGLDFTPSATDSYKSTSGDVFKVFINGVRIYRQDDSIYASGNGFLESTDNQTGNTLNGITDTGTTNWGRTSNTVWVINTTANKVVLNPTQIAATTLYGSASPGLGITVSNGDVIELRRAVQDLKTPAVDFSNASILTEQDLDNSAKNVFHVAQQAVSDVGDALKYNTGTSSFQSYVPGTSSNAKISNVATPTAANDAANKTYVDGSSNTVTVANNITNVNTVAGISGNVTTVAGIASDVTAVANDATDIGAVAGKATEIGRLGTADAVADMAILGTADVVADLNTLGTADIVADMNLLATSSNVAAMALLGTSDAVADMNTLGTSDIVADMNLLATTDNVSNMDTCADNITNVNAVALSIAGSQTYTVTVTNPGSGNVFVLDGNNNPAITLTKGFTYTFDQSDSSNAGHTLKIRDDDDNEYTNGVTLTGTPGSAGAKTVFVVPANAPTTGLRYYCVAHGEGMGNTITTANNDLGEVASIGASNLNTVATNAESTSIVMGIALG
tara:strand:- start:3671 stop:5251 length:1581 start_codon:yes stop_codon:yes gene_type:complete